MRVSSHLIASVAFLLWHIRVHWSGPNCRQMAWRFVCSCCGWVTKSENSDKHTLRFVGGAIVYWSTCTRSTLKYVCTPVQCTPEYSRLQIVPGTTSTFKLSVAVHGELCNTGVLQYDPCQYDACVLYYSSSSLLHPHIWSRLTPNDHHGSSETKRLTQHNQALLLPCPAWQVLSVLMILLLPGCSFPYIEPESARISQWCFPIRFLDNQFRSTSSC